MIKQVAAGQCAALRVVLFGADSIGLVIERGDPDPNSLDRTAPVRVVVVRPGPISSHQKGDVAVVGALEVVTDLGELTVSDPQPYGWALVSNK